jgi:hypothetical protein
MALDVCDRSIGTLLSGHVVLLGVVVVFCVR